jgi:hypothetical protein
VGGPSEHAPIRVLEADPDLANGLAPDEAEAATAALAVPTIEVGLGGWSPEDELPVANGHLGLLMLDGLIARDLRIAGRSCVELIGEGDLVYPWGFLPHGAPVEVEVRWRALEPARLALLDDAFVRDAAAWPEIGRRLVLRAVARSQALAFSLAINCVTGLRNRLLMLLWQLADRWGRVGPSGVSVPLPLTHEMLGRLAGASRPSVSTALKELEVEGLISRRPGGGYLLHGEPPGDAELVAHAANGNDPAS